MKTTLYSLLGAGLALFATFASTRDAAAQSNGDRIVFSGAVTVEDTSKKGKRTYTTAYQIFTMDPDGSNVVQLTNSIHSSSSPRWSPNREYMSFYRAGALYVMEARGEANGGRTFMVAPDVASTGSDWSPDGSMICFPWYGQGIGVIEVDPATGWVGVPVLVWAGDIASWPCWSPDGAKIVFSSPRTDPRSTSTWSAYLTVLDLGSEEETTFYGWNGNIPRWSADGSSIAFSGLVSETITKGRKTTTYTYRELFIVDAALLEFTQVTNFKSYNTTAPTWSSDGTELAFMNMPEQGGEYSIYTMSLDSGETTLLWTDAAGLDWTP